VPACTRARARLGAPNLRPPPRPARPAAVLTSETRRPKSAVGVQVAAAAARGPWSSGAPAAAGRALGAESARRRAGEAAGAMAGAGAELQAPECSSSLSESLPHRPPPGLAAGRDPSVAMDGRARGADTGRRASAGSRGRFGTLREGTPGPAALSICSSPVVEFDGGWRVGRYVWMRAHTSGVYAPLAGAPARGGGGLGERLPPPFDLLDGPLAQLVVPC
jgi:hypothetical protein